MATPDVRALKAANRQWNNLDSEMTREIGKLRFVHPTALLIKDLEFIYRPRELQVHFRRARLGYMNNRARLGYMNIRGYDDDRQRWCIDRRRTRAFEFFDLAPGEHGDMFEGISNAASGIVLGRVVEDNN